MEKNLERQWYRNWSCFGRTEHDLMKMMKSIKINDNQIIDDNLLDNQLEEEEEEEEDNISN